MPTVTGEAAAPLSAMVAAIAAAYKDFTVYKDNDWLGFAKVVKKHVTAKDAENQEIK